MYENKKTLKDLDLNNKKVIVRFDFNVPIKDGIVMNDKRIVAAIPTIKYLLDKKCCKRVVRWFATTLWWY